MPFGLSLDDVPLDDLASALEEAELTPLETPPTASPAKPTEPKPMLERPLPVQETGDEAALDDERFPPIRPQTQREAKPATASARPARRLSTQDQIALFFVLATLLAVVYFVVLWRDPWSVLNPFPPPTEFEIVTATFLPPTSEISTPVSGQNVQATVPANSGSETPSASIFPFMLADTGVIYIPNTNGRACNWSSIAGTVTGMKGEALNGYGIEIQGDALDEKVFSGTAQTYGAGGFELFLNGTPKAGQYVVQLFSTAGAPVSDKYPVRTRETCQENVAVVNFIQRRGL